MALFGHKNRKIGGHLKSTAGKVSGKKVIKQTGKNKRGAVNLSTTLTDRDVCEYFMQVGFDHKGDFQSYMYAKGSAKSVELKIDVVALAAACAGVPVPKLPVFAEVGGSVSVKNTRNNLIAAFVAPELLTAGGRRLQTTKCGQVVFLAMTGYKWESGIAFTAEAGVKTPDIPGLPSFGTGGGDYGGNEDKPTEVESGTYAELASFSVNVEAKASVQAKAGISGSRLYLSDTVPTFIKKGGTANTMDEIEKNLTSVLEHGSKKTYIKEDVKKFLKDHGCTQKRALYKTLITGGNISSNKLICGLEGLQESATNNGVKQMCQHHIRALTDFKSQNVLGPYNFVSLWGMKPEAEAGVSAVAGASVKAGAGGVVEAGAEVGVELKGPGIATSLKFTRFRFQVAALAEEGASGYKAHPLFTRDSKLIGQQVGSGIQARHKKLVESMETNLRHPSNAYVIMTQDTNITYGQMDLTLFELSGKAYVGAEQGLFSASKLQTGVDGETGLGGKVKGVELKVVSMGGEAKVGLEEIRLKGQGSVGLKTALNFMRYEAAIAYWMPPAEMGLKKNEKTNIKLDRGSGFAIGQSVDVRGFNKHLQNVLADPKQKCGYMQALAGRLGVTYEQFKEFLVEHGSTGLINDIAQCTQMKKSERKKYEAYIPVPTAFLIEATFEVLNLPTVEARWSGKGRWILGPSGLGKTLRGVLIPKKINPQQLQAIRLRYRHADEISNERTRFSLGIKFIVELGIQYKSVEEAGSEGIKNLATTWFNNFKKYRNGDQTKACEQAVPQVALLHQ
ncbi:hypothetical protein [Desulfoluna sp.]|uniref:hypothetical protein n=1 Tax=Desulfoluna sp. TaxID=2045199 RepID=UPI002623CB0F|nr:hypothetical protein [Desulfoluna sp.]